MRCSRCGVDNPEGFRFCGSCGAPLAVEQAPAREERKVVTVLFADLVGFTSQAESLDPEDVRELLGAYHRRLRGELERYGGTVEKFIGDAVMALFGAPTAHEDDPERAVRSAFAIRDAIAELNEAERRDLHVRIGITTGEALVNLGARVEAGEGMASGDVVNTAARLQAAAPVDGVLVDERTFRSTERAIVLRAAEPVTAKGKTEPVAVWEAVEPRARLGIDVLRSPRTRLVGREDEVEVLRGALARARRERAPQLVTLIGVPGIGKTRLVQELFQVVEADPELIAWRQGRSLPYGEGVSFWALGEMVKAQAGILETDPDEEAAVKLAHAVADLVPDAEEARWVERALRPLVGLSRDGESGREESFAAWRRFLEGLAERGPAILLFEDLHWADDGLLEFVEYLAEWVSGLPLLVVCTSRPELLGRRPGWGGGKPNATTLSLAPLSDDETARLLGLLLDRAVMPADAQAELLARAGGNPLYTEEFVRMTAEGGGGAELPETVQGIIAARLDALDSADKDLLQDAAVLGKVFWLGAVASLGGSERWEVERRLHELERRQLVRRERRTSVEAESEYAFWHVLTRDVAYAQIPRGRRAEKHRLTAEWIASLSGERAADRADLLAHHYLAALEFARAAGQDTGALAEPARHALRAAGDRALALNSFAAASRFYREAERLWPDDETVGRLLLDLARVLHWGSMEGHAEAATARERLLGAGDVEGAAEAELLLAEIAWFENRNADTVEHLERATRLVADRPLSAAKAQVAAASSRFLMLAGREEEAIERGRVALAMADELGLDELRAYALIIIGTARGNLGHMDGYADLKRGIELGERIGSTEAIRGYINLASLTVSAGDIRRAHELHNRGLEVALRYGQIRGIRFLQAEIALDLYFLGDWDAALTEVDAFIAEVEAGRPHYMEGMCRMVRAELRVARDQVDAALADIEIALARGREANDPQSLLPGLSVNAFLTSELGDRRAAAAAALEQLLAAVDRVGATRAEFWLYPALHAFAAAGRLDDLARLVAREGGASGWLRAARLHLAGDVAGAAAQLEEVGALPDAARTRLTAGGDEVRRAIAFYRSVGATFYLRRAEEVAAASA